VQDHKLNYKFCIKQSSLENLRT